MFKIRLYDLFYGFIRSYVTFGIHDKVTNTKYTHKILGYFAELGRTLGMWVNYEDGRRDLSWYYEHEDDEPYLHVEHENYSNRLDRILEKLENSKARGFFGICYPANQEDLNYLKERLEDFAEGREFLVVADNALFYDDTDDDIIGYYTSSRGTKVYLHTATSEQTEDGIWYAYWNTREESDDI